MYLKKISKTSSRTIQNCSVGWMQSASHQLQIELDLPTEQQNTDIFQIYIVIENILENYTSEIMCNHYFIQLNSII